MKALVIGAAGFVGNYLVNEIYSNLTNEIYATKLENENFENEYSTTLNLNILDKGQILDLLSANKPDFIFHLAAQSSVALSWKNPTLTVDINVKGVLNLLDVIREMPNYNPRLLLIGSGEEYGLSAKDINPISEKDKVCPGNIYAITKATQNMIGRVYAQAYNMQIISTRSFNHIGPNQNEQFVVADFCKQVAMIEKNLQGPVINVGNLEAKRDFTDVRDVVAAYVLLAKLGKAGETYNVGRGKAESIRSVLDTILRNSQKDIKVEVDEAKLRPLDVEIIQPDISKIKRDIGWEPRISLSSSINDTLNYWRGLL